MQTQGSTGFAESLTGISGEIIGPVIAAVILAILAIFWTRSRVLLWARIQFYIRWLIFVLGYNRKRSHLHLVCLSDYVTLIETFRNKLANWCGRQDYKPTIHVHVYTRQLPSAWPLWDGSVGSHTPGLTPLENYFFGFKKFLDDGPNHNYIVQVRRVIVLDRKGSPYFVGRLRQLSQDVHNSGKRIDQYYKTLHAEPGGAYYFEYGRPWPDWLADAVFYGVTDKNSNLNWLWGVTTSYDANEDLILLRVHRLSRTKTSSDLPLPAGIHSLRDLAERAGNWENMQKLGDVPVPE